MIQTVEVRKLAVVLASVSLICLPLMRASVQGDGIEKLQASFLHPPGDTRIMMRWWWFGPAVENEEIDRELGVMKDAGIGGVEIQPVYPVQLMIRPKILPYMSPQFLDAIPRRERDRCGPDGHARRYHIGQRLAVRRPAHAVTEAAGRLRIVQIGVPEGTPKRPSSGNGDRRRN